MSQIEFLVYILPFINFLTILLLLNNSEENPHHTVLEY